ncbi:pentatricopeptide repeat-containing protein [Tripterygium wilfordii]|uniref:Pentatricopeptide repeat-containing protein n=1 Tax=Tripterygium wilfordii TaxID=458696 RepID=A0A7J7CKZ4_TRIWF|nr:pentatricopeptide repeat-containing protein At1g74600, chloroplastic [Tripterygium wilfordii]KAF5734691.1 pentatricopeptide repeat-containing protein [Tripterygium wilfordii]
MSALIWTEVSVRARKFMSSLAHIESPSIVKHEHQQNLTHFDPSQFFNNQRKSRHCTFENTKMVHAHLLRTSCLSSDLFSVNSLLDWYCRSAGMDDALKLFDTIPHPNVISWNIMISGFNHRSQFDISWRIFCRMHSLGFEPNEITYGSVLSACKSLQSLMCGKQVYSLTVRNGYFSSGHVRAAFIDLLAKNCCFEDALRVFNDVECDNVVCWNAIISGAVKNEEYWFALSLYQEMLHGSLVPNSFTLSSILTACATLEELDIGKGVQGQAIKCGAKDVFVETAIVDLYAKCGEIDEATKEFLRMPIHNVVSWTAIISGFVMNDDSISALKLFKEMRKTGEVVNIYTITTVITGCAKPGMLTVGTQLHSWILKTGFYCEPVVGASIMSMYSKIGAIDLSEGVFREVQNIKNLSTCAMMISSFVQNQCSKQAIKLFQRVLEAGLRPDKFCCSSILSVIECLILGTQMHGYTLKTGLVFDLSVGSSLFTMYSKCGSLVDSSKVFEQIPFKDNVAWASMITGYAEHDCADQAFLLFREMLSEESKPDEMTLTAILTACSVLKSLQMGREIHGYAFRAGLGKRTFVGGALVNMYSKCGALELARKVFDTLPQKDQICRSSLVSGYAQNGLLEEAVLVFKEMLISDLKIDSFTLSSVIGAVALLARSGVGTQLHAYAMKIGLDSEVSVGSSLVTMYSKCGSIEVCRKAFDHIGKPDLIGWTAMIVSYAQHGKGEEALRVYELMRKEGIRPDSVTLVGVLSACSHNGLVEEGYFYFDSMIKDHGIKPNQRHYACMVDLLGRAGRLKEAEAFINNMPIKPGALVWGTLLAAAKVHGNIKLGSLAAKKAMELDPGDAGTYVSLANIYADVGQWEEVVDVRDLMKGTGARKEPGWSSV